MKPLASRTDALRQSDIRAVTFAVNAVDGINLGQGICDLPTPDPIKAGAKAAIDGSLETMGLDHIDLMIIHSPQPWEHFGADDRFFEGNLAAWKALEEAYEAGKLKAIETPLCVLSTSTDRSGLLKKLL